MKIRIFLLLYACLQINFINAAQETKEAELYQPTSLHEITFTQVGQQFIEILIEALAHNIDLNDFPRDQREVLEWGLTPEQSFASLIHIYSTPLKKLNLLDIAIACNNIQVVDYLLRAGADVNYADYNDEIPLSFAIKNNVIDIISLLLAAGADINQANAQGKTPLFMAIEILSDEIVPILISAGADVNHNDSDRITPLLALAGREPENPKSLIIAQQLVDAGANINAKGIDGATPLHGASLFNNPEMIKFLLAVGADKTITNFHNYTALQYAETDELRELFK